MDAQRRVLAPGVGSLITAYYKLMDLRDHLLSVRSPTPLWVWVPEGPSPHTQRGAGPLQEFAFWLQSATNVADCSQKWNIWERRSLSQTLTAYVV